MTDKTPIKIRKIMKFKKCHNHRSPSASNRDEFLLELITKRLLSFRHLTEGRFSSSHFFFFFFFFFAWRFTQK